MLEANRSWDCSRPLIRSGRAHLSRRELQMQGRLTDLEPLDPMKENGKTEVLTFTLITSESCASWGMMLEDLAARGLREPVLCIIDGSKGLKGAVTSTWTEVPVQRCIVHKLWSLETRYARRALPDLRADVHAITEA
jgi:transposase-like protein